MASAVGYSILGRVLVKGKTRDNGVGWVMCVSSLSSYSSTSSGLIDQYRMLRIQPGASEMEVKKAFRQLAPCSIIQMFAKEETWSAIQQNQ